jgi:hypothetical protein
MSIKLMSAVLAMGGVSCTKKMVLISLADHANDEGRSIYPSVEKTAQRVGLTARGTRKIIKDLVQDGFLIRVVKSHGYRTNEYRIDVEKLGQYAVHEKNIIPEPNSGYSKPNPEPHAQYPEPHSINPEPRSAESSLTVKNLKDADAKNASAPVHFGKNGNHLTFRNALLSFFVNQTGIIGPPKDFKAANKLWTTPILQIGDLVDFDIQKGQDLISLSLVRLKGLTVANPNSIVKTAQSIAGEQKIHAEERQFREEIY